MLRTYPWFTYVLLNSLAILSSIVLALSDDLAAQPMDWQRLRGPISSDFGYGIPVCLGQGNGDSLYVYARGGLYVTADNGQNWHALFPVFWRDELFRGFEVWGNVPILGVYPEVPISVSRLGPKIHGIGFCGFYEKGIRRIRKHFFHFSTSGDDHPLPGTVTSIDAGSGTTVYAAIPGQLYRSLDTGATWSAHGTKIDTAHITATIEHGARLFVGTFDAGIHELVGNEWVRHSVGGQPGTVRNFASSSTRLLAACGTDGLFEWHESTHEWKALRILDHPVNAQDILRQRNGAFVLATNEGIFRLEDGSAQWKPIGLPGTMTGFQTSVDGDIYVSTVDGHYTSKDDGLTWRDISHDGSRHTVHSMIETVGGELLAATQYGVFRSMDTGRHWEFVTVAQDSYYGGYTALAATDSNTVLAIGTDFSSHLSHSRGATWIQRPGSDIGRLTRLKYDGVNLIAYSSHYLFHSSDSGRSWQLRIDLSHPEQNDRITDVTFIGKDRLLLARRDSGFVTSSDGGKSWTNGYKNWLTRSYRDEPAIAWRGSEIFAKTYKTGIFFRSTDEGSTWDSISKLPEEVTLDARPMWESRVQASLMLASKDVILAASGHSLFRSTDDGKTWSKCNSIYGQVASLDSTRAGVFFVSTWRGGLYRSDDRGITWRMSSRGFQKLSRVGNTWYQQFACYPDGKLVMGDGFIYRSTDDGNSWIVNDTTFKPRFTGRFDMRPNGELNWGLAQTNKASLLRSLDSGMTWHLPPDHDTMWFSIVAYDSSVLAYGAYDYPTSGVMTSTRSDPWVRTFNDNAIDIALGKDRRVYYLTSGSFGTELYVSKKGKMGLPFNGFFLIALDQSGNIYLAGHIGSQTRPYDVWVSSDDGKSWSSTSEAGLDLEAPIALRVHNSYLYFVLHGGGIWRAPIRPRSQVERRDTSKLMIHYADHEVTITAPLQAEHELKLFDLLGRLLGEFTMRNGACVLDVRDYAPGTYVFRIEQSGYSGKILVGP